MILTARCLAFQASCSICANVVVELQIVLNLAGPATYMDLGWKRASVSTLMNVCNIGLLYMATAWWSM